MTAERKERKILAPILAVAMTAGSCTALVKGNNDIESATIPAAENTSTPSPTTEIALSPDISLSPTPNPEEYLEGLVCPAEPTDFDFPQIGEVIVFQGLNWKIVGITEETSEICQRGIKIEIQLCSCLIETPTLIPSRPPAITATHTRRPPEPSRTPSETPHPPSETPRPTETPVPTIPTPTPPIPTPVPTNEDIIPTATKGG